MITQLIEIVTIEDKEVHVNPHQIVLIEDCQLNEITGSLIFMNIQTRYADGSIGNFGFKTYLSRKEVNEMINKNNDGIINRLVKFLKKAM